VKPRPVPRWRAESRQRYTSYFQLPSAVLGFGHKQPSNPKASRIGTDRNRDDVKQSVERSQEQEPYRRAVEFSYNGLAPHEALRCNGRGFSGLSKKIRPARDNGCAPFSRPFEALRCRPELEAEETGSVCWPRAASYTCAVSQTVALRSFRFSHRWQRTPPNGRLERWKSETLCPTTQSQAATCSSVPSPNFALRTTKTTPPSSPDGWETKPLKILSRGPNSQIIPCSLPSSAARFWPGGSVTDAGTIGLNYVSPDARFRGVSRALLQALELRAAERGNTRCTLISTETGHRFYRSNGYFETGAQSGALGASSGVPMSKPL
jgi:ribosomal protein S18 acetylase RimI-like enzyme